MKLLFLFLFFNYYIILFIKSRERTSSQVKSRVVLSLTSRRSTALFKSSRINIKNNIYRTRMCMYLCMCLQRVFLPFTTASCVVSILCAPCSPLPSLAQQRPCVDNDRRTGRRGLEERALLTARRVVLVVRDGFFLHQNLDKTCIQVHSVV